MTIDRKSTDLEFLISRWRIETHTFVVAWGEFGPSLEDVAMLTSLAMFSEAKAASLYPNGEDKKRIEALKPFSQS